MEPTESTHPTDLAPRGADRPDDARILGFYDRLRRAVARRGGEKGPGKVADMLLLAPDVFILVARMTLDRRVPSETRALLGGALAYFLLPIDLVPEAFVGLGGFLDDLVISSAVLQRVFDREVEALAEEHWNGSTRLREVLTSVATNTDDVLSGRGLERVKKYLASRGLGRGTPPRAKP